MGSGSSKIMRRIFLGRMEALEDSEVDALIQMETLGMNIPASRPTWGDKQQTLYGKTKKYASNKLTTSKYTKWSFLPKIIYFQMKRILNFYYMFVIGIQLTLFYLIEIPLLEVLSNAVPFTIIILITMIKEAYEDSLRHSDDYLVNNRKVNIIKDGFDSQIKAKNLKVGTLVKVQRLEHVPADLLIIGSTDPLSRYQLSTANLDGESHLKMCYCPTGLPNINTISSLEAFNCLISYSKPSAEMRECNGFLITSTKELKILKNALDHREDEDDDEEEVVTKHTCVSCKMDNMALKGTTVKNTEAVYGVVIFTGKDTRFAMNSKKSRTKFGTVERTINKILVFTIFLVILLVGGATAMSLFWVKSLRDKSVLEPTTDVAWYLWPVVEKLRFDGIWHLKESIQMKSFWFALLERIGEFLFLFNQMIPINLYIFIEFQQILSSKFFSWDLDMLCPETDEQAIVNTSDISEELGQIQYLFTDKTGTLTQNQLELRHVSIEGKRYDIREDHSLWRISPSKGTEDYVRPGSRADVTKFLRILALCHSVHLVPKRVQPHLAEGIKHVSKKMKLTSSLDDLMPHPRRHSLDDFLGEFEYEATSQDEKALVEACCRLGVIFMGETAKIITLEVHGERETFKRHFFLEFEAARRCMSVIVEDQKGEIWLLNKGDDYTVLEKTTAGMIKSTSSHTEDFVTLGMRTMTVAKKQINREGLIAFSDQLKAARQLQDPRARLDAIYLLYRKIESNFYVVGSVGVEDHLQEDVTETLEILAEAGIKVWILTGDKVETAIQVAVACEYIKQGRRLCYATDHVSESDVLQNWRDIAVGQRDVKKQDWPVFVIDGDNLDIGMKVCPQIVTSLIIRANRVIFCHMSPLQKARVVRMVKSSKGKPITAAVGDGANDVAMIHEAHIGIGIFGLEGRQAARSADFAVARFSALRKAILVHGHWYYVRLANLTKYCFYYRAVFTYPQAFFLWDTGFSGQSLYSIFFYTLYSLLLMGLPIFCYGYMDQPFSSDTLLEYPYMYKDLTKNRLLRGGRIFLWQITAIFHAAVIYYVSRFAMIYAMNPDICDFTTFGALVFSCVVTVVHMKLFQFTRYFTCLNFLACLFTYSLYPGLFYFVSEVDLSKYHELLRTEYQGEFLTMVTKYEFWLVLIFVLFCCLIPDFTIQTFASYSTLFDSTPTDEVYHEPIRFEIVREDHDDYTATNNVDQHDHNERAPPEEQGVAE